MGKWLILYASGRQEVIEAEDLLDIHNKTDEEILAVIRVVTE